MGHTAAARATLQRPDQSLRTRGLDRGLVQSQGLQPLSHHAQVLVLAEGIEAHPQAEALGQRDLFLNHLAGMQDRKSTRLNSSHLVISYAVFCLKKKKIS